MNIKSTKINGMYIVDTLYRRDTRGFFARMFCQEALASVLEHRKILQINHSGTRNKGTVRGFHYQQPPHAEMKLIRCIEGRIWDVVVDLRTYSPTFMQWYGQEISEDNAKMIVIPEGCAHGFQALEDNCELLYLHTAFYTPNAELGVHVQDRMLAVDWPLPVIGLSERDKNLSQIDANFSGVGL